MPLLPRRALLLGSTSAAVAVPIARPPPAPAAPPAAAPGLPPPSTVVAVVAGPPSQRRTVLDKDVAATSGTGVAVSPGLVLTTATVAAAASRGGPSLTVLAVDAAGASHALVGRVVATDPRAGVALIAVEDGFALAPAAFAPSASLAIGQRVWTAVASPVDGAPSLSAGVLGGVGRGLPLAGGVGALVGALQTDARVGPGAPLLDAAGHVVGVGVAPAVVGEAAPAGLGFALPSDAVVAAVMKVAKV
jgi:S1-C subfamily serine protease